MTADDVLQFWFEQTSPAQRFRKDPDFDQTVIRLFASLHRQARQCELASWRESARGALAEIIVLDQFSRNMFRESAEAFAQDALALALGQELVRRGLDKELSPEQQAFAYLPWMHSESALIHRQAVVLFSQPGLEQNLDFELRHKAIIDRFGRYPHRNAILGRESSQQELEFLDQPGSAF